ncbi:type 1 glutamine amidotransferase domain-containing protein [Pseudidiomarina salilacus]|uniref:type 1 glutamine amidotransferase domain-containing protein n=1 Tax=Pseudidiomarina salilacus TaxID=3384452 RepID=UPI003984C6FC
MKNFILFLTTAALILGSCCLKSAMAQTPSNDDTAKRVLMLISSNGTEAAPELSYDLEELAQAYLVLNDNGVQIDIMSPKGGAVLVKNNKDNLAYIQRFKKLALDQLKNTLAPTAVQLSNYHAVFVIGGSGAMIDLPTDTATQQLLSSAVASDMTITAVCHGPAALVNLQNNDGSWYVDGKRMNSFTNTEEHAFSAEHIEHFPFLLEDKLKEHGAIFVNNAPMLPYVAVDGNLITAQNPGSVAKAAEATVLALGLPLQTRQPFHDEATMALISHARETGSAIINLALARDVDNYDMNYLALYGFYAYRLADEQNKARELELMQTIRKHFSHPEYDTQLILNLLEQGQHERALDIFEEFKVKFAGHSNLDRLEALF